MFPLPVTPAAQQLRALLSAASSDPQVAPIVKNLLSLLDQALSEAEVAGMRQLARSIPHELSQPLSEIRGYSELLVEHDYAPDEQADLLRRIAQASARLGELVHMILRMGEDDALPPRRMNIAGREVVSLAPSGSSTATPTPLDELKQSVLGHVPDVSESNQPD